MKRSWMISLMVITFVMGAMFGVSSNVTPSNQEERATLSLEEQIQEYEQAIADGHEFNPPYSEQFVHGSSNDLAQSALTQQASLDPDLMAQDAQMEGYSNLKINHNAISKIGQDIGTFLMSLVREILRTIVKFFDYLIAS